MAKQAASNSKSSQQSKNNEQSKAQKQAQQKTQQQQQAEQERIQAMIADNDSFNLKFSWNQVEPIYQQKLKNMAQNLKIKGFRKGKVPLSLAEKEIDSEKLINQVLKELLPQAYQDKIQQENYQPISEPEFHAISLNKNNDWELKVIFAQKPKINLEGYQKVVKSAKKKAEKQIKKHQQELEKKAQDQQQTNSDKKQEKADQDKTQNSKTADEEVSGQPQKMNKQQKQDAIIQTVFAELIDSQKPAIPEVLIKQNTQRELQKLQKKLKQLNVSMEDFLKARNLTQDQLTMQISYNSLNQLQVEFLLNAIAEQENIKVEDKEVEQRIADIEDEKMQKRVKDDEHYQNYIKATLAKQKVIQYLLDL